MYEAYKPKCVLNSVNYSQHMDEIKTLSPPPPSSNLARHKQSRFLGETGLIIHYLALQSLWSSPADIRNNQSGSFALAMIYNVFNEKQMEACILINAYTYDYAVRQQDYS